ncbi:TonB-dependent receptor [Maribacter luteus]|uniref:TonB-dependent receptor n=1 Tax=Maribacter luteus TaxID=2594478 RepID=A0A6I2MQN5_9FLAO|nr:TonB-dependent receptor [Maribacter luteus]MRX63516.1 TonB-dependent receptor [Maribacter luteus]
MKKILLLTLLLINSVFLVNAQDISVSGTTSDSSGPLPGVNIRVKGSTIGVISDFDGNYTIPNAPSTGTLVFSYIGYATEEVAIDGQSTINLTLKESAEQLTEAIVIGSRGQPRTKLKTAVPIDVISISENAVNMPEVDLSQMLTKTAPSFTAYQSQGGDLASQVIAPSLRGLAPNQMLVLINGKRRHTSALLAGTQTGTDANSVDMSFIPSGSIERVEILRDGASAQYGSDAIAGVINIILKKGTDKFTGTLTAGGYTNQSPDFSYSDLSDEEIGLIEAGTGDPDGLNYQFDGNYGFSFDNGGYLNITGMFKQADRTIRASVLPEDRFTLYSDDYLNNQTTSTDGNVIITNPELVSALAAGNTALADELRTVSGLMDARGLEQYDVATYAGNPLINQGGLGFNLEIPVNDDVNFYSYGDLGFKYTEGFSCYYRRANQSDRTSYYLYPNGFRPQMYTNQTNLGLTAGVSGKIGDYDFDFSNTFGKNTMNIGMFNTWNASLGDSSPTDMNVGKHSFLQNTGNFDVSKFYDDVLEGLNVAGGIEFRVENYAIEAGQVESYTSGDAGFTTATEDNQALIGPDGFPLEDLGGNQIVDVNGDPIELEYAGISQYQVKGYSPGCQCFNGFSPINESDTWRSVIAGYLDVELDVTEDFFVGGALRIENYSDFGNVMTGKIATRYSIGDNFSIRGSYSSGYRAPSLQELNYSQGYTYFIDEIPYDAVLYRNGSAAAKAIGLDILDQETSGNLSVGFTAKITNNFNLTVDAYSIKIKDRIFTTSQFTSSDAPVLEPIIGAGQASFRINGGDISTKGVEIVANYDTKIGTGKLDFTLSATLRENKFDQAVVPELNTVLTEEELIDKYITRGSIGQFEKGTPSSKYLGTLTYKIGKWSTMLTGVRWGGVTALDSYEGTLSDGSYGYADQFYTPEFTVDLGVTYAFSDKLSLTVGGNNIFNQYPEIQRNENRGFYLYSNYQQGSNGAYYFGRLTFSL